MAFPARMLSLTLLATALVACDKDEEDDTNPPGPDTNDTEDPDTGEPDTGDSGDADLAGWTIAVFMNGDNDLEGYVMHDLNELERADGSDEVHIVVQADRAEGYSTNDGDWTGTRRYYITHDDDSYINSEILEEMGEMDMGDPQVLSDFLVWAHQNYPAERFALVLWNHGDGWQVTDGPEPPWISWDDESGNDISIAQGELNAGLDELVAQRGPLDVVAFDACSMGSWEVAHSLKDHALYMAASQATVGMSGLQYETNFSALAADPQTDGAELAQAMAYQTVHEGGEWTFAAIDLAEIERVSSAVDALAGLVLDDPSLEQDILQARQEARGTDNMYKNWYLDLYDLASVLSQSSDPDLAAAGDDIMAEMDIAVLAAYGSGLYGWTGGLNILFDYDWLNHLSNYSNGEGATWSQDTRWDDLLRTLAGW